MNNNDLIALRWQLVRTVEAEQLLEEENLRLRARLQQVKESTSKSTKMKSEAGRKIATKMKVTVTGLRDELHEARSQYFGELEEMKRGFKKLASTLKQAFVKNKETMKKVKTLQEMNEQLQGDISRITAHSDKKSAHLADELSRVKKDLIDSNAQHTHALSIIEEKDKALRQHGEDMNELQNKLKVSHQNIAKLNRTVKQLEDHKNSEAEQLKLRFMEAETAFNDKINTQNMEITHLKNQIDMYKAEIARLSAKQGSKKTPFTQYVDLKNQNEDLKAKVIDLKNIVRNVDPNHKPKKAGHLLGVNHVDSVDDILAKGKVSGRKSLPTSPRIDSSHVIPVPMKRDGSTDLGDMDMPTINPRPPPLLTESRLSTQPPRPTHPTLRLPSSKSTPGQRPSMYRNSYNRQRDGSNVIRSSSSENPDRPLSGTAKKTSRAPSPIINPRS